MSKYFRISIYVLPVLLLGYIGNVSACTIDAGPTPIFAAYMRNVAKEISDIRAFANSNNACNGSIGTFSNENRFLSLMNSIDARLPLGRDVFTDFEFRAMLVMQGQARNPVMRQSEMIRNLEQSTIAPAIRSVSSTCTLSTIMPDGRTVEEALKSILITHRDFESYYKNIALGNARQPDSQTDDMKALYDEIRDNYSPHATASCKGAGDVGTLEDIMQKIQTRLGQKAKKTENSQNTWNEALDLFSGKAASNTNKYQELQRKLLQTELARQGLTKRARDTMLGNLTCFQQNTTPTSSVEEMGKARANCLDSVVGGLENLTIPFRKTIFDATNTEDYIRRVLTHDLAKTRLESDMAGFWQKLEKAKNVDEKLNEKMITDLVNMHGNIVTTNNLLKLKIEEMYTNCMKAQPNIPCPRSE